MPSPFDSSRKVAALLSLLDDWWWLGNVPSEDMSLEKIGKPHRKFIRNEAFGGY